MYEDRAEETPTLDDSLRAGDYCGQAYWRWDGFYREGKLNWLWHPNPWLYLATTALACCGIAVLYFDRRRAAAVALGSLLVYFAALTSIGAPPEYRYRMILEPILIVCIAQLGGPLSRAWMRQSARDRTSTVH